MNTTNWVRDEAARQFEDFNDDTDINTAVLEYGESCLRAGLREAARQLEQRAKTEDRNYTLLESVNSGQGDNT